MNTKFIKQIKKQSFCLILSHYDKLQVNVSQFILFDYNQNACRWHFHQLFAIINDYATIRKYGDATKEQNQTIIISATSLCSSRVYNVTY